ncbi:MAG TPA: hypothetical protein VKE22_24040 [Haliangiales bacterium]|nr:hypothetical protein [Haliangiales bacterium]
MRGIRMDRLERIDGVTVFRVDGRRIRDTIDVEFTNGHHHFSRAYIPRDEVWLDRDGGETEWPFWAQRQVHERSLMAGGATYLEAVRKAARREHRLRGGERRDVRSARIRRLAAVDGREVWLVSGREVRDHAYTDFTLGGHGYRYRFIPRAEIWIDNAVVASERPAILHHEVVEVGHMRSGLSYDAAHALASEAEIAFRRRVRVRQ